VAGPSNGPCDPWAAQADLRCLNEDDELPGTCVGTTVVTGEEIETALEVSSYVMWALSGRQFGTCSVHIRPCRRQCLTDAEMFVPWSGNEFVRPALYRGLWYNIGCGCGTECSCTEVCEVVLPAPVVSVDLVMVDGVPLAGAPDPEDPEAPPADYRVDNWRTLVRMDGECWPLCQDMEKPTTEVGTWCVSLTYGVAVPAAGKTAVAEMACELLKGWVGQPCRFPQRLTSLSRQGVSASLFDPMEFLSEGRTGLFYPDLFLNAANPHKLTARPTVWSPDRPYGRVSGT
jgi:hypothetical protein